VAAFQHDDRRGRRSGKSLGQQVQIVPQQIQPEHPQAAVQVGDVALRKQSGKPADRRYTAAAEPGGRALARAGADHAINIRQPGQ